RPPLQTHLYPVPLGQGGTLHTRRKSVKRASSPSATLARTSRSKGAEKERCRGFLGCGLFLILAAFLADTRSNRGIGESRRTRNERFQAADARVSQGESPLKHAKALSPGRMP